jgi:hypothetical protein
LALSFEGSQINGDSTDSILFLLVLEAATQSTRLLLLSSEVLILLAVLFSLKMNGCTTPLIWGCPADFVDISHLWPLWVMAAVPTDAVAPDPADLDLREDLEFEL